MRLDHPIFHTPLAAELELEQTEVPEQYEAALGKDAPALTTWTVHSGKFPDGVDVGMVSDPYGFEDSPDAEWISSGINSKGPTSVALGRQGNYFLWGFYGAPDRMTESAKRVFLNTLVYMKQFDGQVPLVTKESIGRDIIFRMIDFVPLMTERGDDGLQWIENQFGPEAREATDLEPGALRTWYQERLEQLYADGRQIKADPDLVELKLSNRRAEFFTILLARLIRDPEDPIALRLARRYVGEEHGQSREALTSFVLENSPWLYFSDVGGYRWRVDSRAKARAGGAGRRAAGGQD